jgi:hypothetical protein
MMEAMAQMVMIPGLGSLLEEESAADNSVSDLPVLAVGLEVCLQYCARLELETRGDVQGDRVDLEATQGEQQGGLGGSGALSLPLGARADRLHLSDRRRGLGAFSHMCPGCAEVCWWGQSSGGRLPLTRSICKLKTEGLHYRFIYMWRGPVLRLHVFVLDFPLQVV